MIWCCQDLLFDGALGDKTLTAVLEARWVLMGYQPQSTMEAMVRPFRKFQSLIWTGFEPGDPNMVILEARCQGASHCHWWFAFED